MIFLICQGFQLAKVSSSVVRIINKWTQKLLNYETIFYTLSSNKPAFQVLKCFEEVKPHMLMEGKFGLRAEINSETPVEITVSMVAELIKVRGETPRH